MHLGVFLHGERDTGRRLPAQPSSSFSSSSSSETVHFRLLRFLYGNLKGEADEFRKSLHQILQASFLRELGLGLVLHLRVMLDPSVHHLGVVLHGEGDTGHRLPDVLFVFKALADDTNLVRDQIGRKEANPKLPKNVAEKYQTWR